MKQKKSFNIVEEMDLWTEALIPLEQIIIWALQETSQKGLDLQKTFNKTSIIIAYPTTAIASISI